MDDKNEGVSRFHHSSIKALTAAFCGFFFAFLLFPHEALAWGPGVHMVTGNWLLQNLSLLPAGLAAAVGRYPSLFLQGCLSPDIFIGKGCVAKEGHSHNWRTGLDLLEKAHTKAKLAYAGGYLSHLALDTVAHNVFVPSAINTAPGRGLARGKLAHVYLESQADNAVRWSKNQALAAFHSQGSLGAERMLLQATRQNSMLFWLKKALYRGSIAIGGRKFWRRSMRALDNALHGDRCSLRLQSLLAVGTRAMVDVLREPYDSAVLELDPVGTEALAACGRNFEGACGRNDEDGYGRSSEKACALAENDDLYGGLALAELALAGGFQLPEGRTREFASVQLESSDVLVPVPSYSLPEALLNLPELDASTPFILSGRPGAR